MRKIFLVVIIAGFALTLLFTARPYLSGWLQMSASSESAFLENIISLEPVEQLSIMQGKSGQALIIANKTDAPVKFNLGHAHGYLAIDPQSEILQPETTRLITLHVDDFCPSGEIELLVFLLAEVEDETFGMETVDLIFNVLPGELKLEEQDNSIIATWNDATAPPGVLIYYRASSREAWQEWGKPSRSKPPADLAPGNHLLEFMGKLGQVESAVETFEIFVEGVIEPETKPRLIASESEPPAAEDPGPPEPFGTRRKSPPSTFKHDVDINLPED
jgi:hypothetical protein